MTRYSISTLEKLSGVKAHTIRIWEQRYNILIPQRTNTNIRFYDDDQLKKLLSIVTLTQNGFRISNISQFSEEELSHEVTEILDGKEVNDGIIMAFTYQLIASSLTFDSIGFENTYSKLQNLLDTEDAFSKVMLPLMKIILFEWSAGKINSEKKHFLGNQIRQKLLTAIDTLPLVSNPEEKWLLFLPPNEYQEIAMLYAHYLLKRNNKNVLYLGPNISAKDVDKVAKSFNPTHAMFSFFRELTVHAGEKYMKAIISALPDSELIVSGNIQLINKLKSNTRIVIAETLSDFKQRYLF